VAVEGSVQVDISGRYIRETGEVVEIVVVHVVEFVCNMHISNKVIIKRSPDTYNTYETY
jgi:hypothetical protein